MKKYIMALDQGTTSCRCILFDRAGAICSVAQKEFTQIFPKPGWVEHDAEEIWQTTRMVAAEAMIRLGITGNGIAAIGITNQRETTVVWDKNTGKPIANAIVWQCRRTSEMIDGLISEGYGEMLRAKTGLFPDAYFSASKIRWLLEHVPGAREKAERGELLFGTIDTWLLWNLTGGKVHVTDVTNASRTMLYNIHTLCWDQELLDLFRIPSSMLPEVKPSSCVYGTTDPELFGAEIPISGAAGDQQCALFGQCCFTPGEMKITYGTGCFLLMNTGTAPVSSTHGLVTTVAVGFEDHVEYALEGSVFIAGAAMQWLRDELKMIEKVSESAAVSESVEDTAGGYVVPAFTGLGAPYWNQRARGIAVGLTRGFNRAHFIRATLESLAYQAYDICAAMVQDSGISVSNLKVDGGASANDFLLRFQSNLLRCNVIRPNCIETTALGAAYLAGLAVGYWKDLDDIRSNWSVDRTFYPDMEESRRRELLRGWKKAIRCAILWGDSTEDGETDIEFL